MKICRTIVASSIAFLLLCGLQGCKKTNKNGVLVTVTSMIPNRGGTGTVVTITGTGFYADTSQETVSVALLNANILSATATQIVFSVPMVKDSATLDSTFVLVTVQDQAVVTAGTFYFDNAGVGGADVSTFAGSGSGGSVNATGTAASFQSPENGVFDQSGNMYVADYGNNEIRKITPAGVVSTFAGSTTAGWKDGPASQALFNAPSGLVFDNNGNLYVSDELNNRIRMIDPSGTVSTVAGSGTTGYYDAPGTGAQFNRPIGLAYDSVTATLYVADSRNNVIRMIQVQQSYAVMTFAGLGVAGSQDGQFQFGNPTGVTFNSPRGLALYHVNTQETILYVADYSNNKIRECLILGGNVAVSTASGNANNQAGFSNGTTATFDGPNSLAIGFSKSMNVYELLIADASNHAIRESYNTDLSTLFTGSMPVETLAGSGLPGLKNGAYLAAQFDYPDGVAYNPVDGNLYVIEFGNNDIRKVILQ
jgi:serine/threonine protein kinase, bacterial